MATFEFTCPACNSTLEIPLSVTDFACPVCDAPYQLEAPKPASRPTSPRQPRSPSARTNTASPTASRAASLPSSSTLDLSEFDTALSGLEQHPQFTGTATDMTQLERFCNQALQAADLVFEKDQKATKKGKGSTKASTGPNSPKSDVAESRPKTPQSLSRGSTVSAHEASVDQIDLQLAAAKPTKLEQQRPTALKTQRTTDSNVTRAPLSSGSVRFQVDVDQSSENAPQSGKQTSRLTRIASAIRDVEDIESQFEPADSDDEFSSIRRFERFERAKRERLLVAQSFVGGKENNDPKVADEKVVNDQGPLPGQIESVRSYKSRAVEMAPLPSPSYRKSATTASASGAEQLEQSQNTSGTVSEGDVAPLTESMRRRKQASQTIVQPTETKKKEWSSDDADANKTLTYEMCDVCQVKKARIECRDEACWQTDGNRLFCQECNAEVHQQLKHAQIEYIPRHANELDRMSTQHSHRGDDEHHDIAQLLRLSTRRAIFDNPLMKSWRRMSKCAKFWFRLLTTVRACFSHRRNALPFWTSTIRTVESTRGSSVSAWFYFAKWIFMLNLVLALMFCVLIIPSLFVGSYHIGDWSNLKGLAVGSGLDNTFFFYGAYKSSYFGDYSTTTTSMQNSTVWNSLTNSSVVLLQSVTTTTAVAGWFKMDLAWFLVTSLALLVSLLATIAHVDENVIKNRDFPVSQLVFGQFNHRICDPGAASLQQSWLAISLKTILLERSEQMEAKQNQSWTVVLRRIFGMFWSLIITLVTVTFISLIIYYEHPSTTRSTLFGISSVNEWLNQYTSIPDTLLLYVVPLVVSIFKAITPWLIEALVNFEMHKSSAAFRHLFFRVFALRMFFVFAVMFQTFNSATSQSCIESAVGIVFYRLVIFDFIIDALMSTLVAGFVLAVKRCANAYCCPSKPNVTLEKVTPDDSQNPDLASTHQSNTELDDLKSEFDIPSALLSLMYRQALIWSGACYAPILPFVGVVLGFLEVGFKAMEVLWFKRAPQRPLGVGRQNSFFRSLLVVTLLASFVPYTYFIRLSSQCGPFQVTSGSSLRIYENFMSYIDQLPTWVATALAYCSNAVLLWVVITLLTLALYVVWRRAAAIELDLHECDVRLRMEQKEKVAIIRTHHIKFDVAGRDMFKSFMIEEMGELGQRYAPKLLEIGFCDLVTLLRMDDDDLQEMLEQQVEMPNGLARLFVAKVRAKRLENVRI